MLTAFLIYVQQFFRPIQLASQVYTQAQAALAGAERIYNILDEEPEPADPPGRQEARPARGRIAFEHVTFAYDPGRPVLHDVSFEIEPGQTVALVGPTGAGKTTIASLIPRFYDATGGAVRIDGRDVREVARKNLRATSRSCCRSRSSSPGTIAENIGYGRSGDLGSDAARRSRPRPAWSAPTTSSRTCPTATIPCWARAAGRSARASASSSPSPGRSWPTRAS